jgi:hypothetical protein
MSNANSEDEELPKDTVGDFIIDLILRPTSMLVVDTIVLFLSILCVVYAILRFFNILGDQPFIQDCEFTLNVVDCIASIYVGYGVALESRAHLIRRMEKKDHHISLRLNGVSEHIGIILVVLGLVLEVIAQLAIIADDIKVDPASIVGPLCILSLAVLLIGIQQLLVHLTAVIRALKSKMI